MAPKASIAASRRFRSCKSRSNGKCSKAYLPMAAAALETQCGDGTRRSAPSSQIAGLPEPGNSVGDTLAVGPRGVAEISPRLGVGKEHALARHAQAVAGGERFPPAPSGPELGAPCQGIDGRNRKPQPRGASPDHVRDVRQHGPKMHIFPAQNIALADVAAMQ